MIRRGVTRRCMQNRGVHPLGKIGLSCELQIHRPAARIIPISGIGDRQRGGGRRHATAPDFGASIVLAGIGGNNLPACDAGAPVGVNKKDIPSKGRRNFTGSNAKESLVSPQAGFPAAVSSSNSNGDPPILRLAADITLAGRSMRNLCKTGAKCGKCDWIPEILCPQPNVPLKNGRMFPISLLSVVTGPPKQGESEHNVGPKTGR